MRVMAPLEGIIVDKKTIETRYGNIKYTNNLRKGTNVLINYDYCYHTIKSIISAEETDDAILIDGCICVCQP